MGSRHQADGRATDPEGYVFEVYDFLLSGSNMYLCKLKTCVWNYFQIWITCDRKVENAYLIDTPFSTEYGMISLAWQHFATSFQKRYPV